MKLIRRLARKVELWIQRRHEIGKFDGIALVDLNHYTPYFRKVITAALQLIKDTDPRRFNCVQRHIRAIVNSAQPFGGGAYNSGTKTCEFDFRVPAVEQDVVFYTAWYACALVHEATHGRLRARGIDYTPENRVRIEELCTTEERRFARRLQLAPEVLAWLRPSLEFDPRRWQRHWKSTPWTRLMLVLRRIRRRERSEERKRREEGREYHILN